MDWVGTWATGPQLVEIENHPPAPGLPGNTLRQVLFSSIGGTRLRLRLSNELGSGPVTMSAVHVARSLEGSAIDQNSDVALTFSASPSATIQPGQALFSDPFDFSLEPLSRVAITIHFELVPGSLTGHPGSRTTSHLLSGNAVSATHLPGAVPTEHWYYLTGLDVLARAPAASIVTLGDSITDGRGSTTDQNDRWPDQLSRRLRKSHATAHIAVLNQGIGGNAVVSGGLGPTALERFDRDVLGQRGVRWLIVLGGVNDIGSTSSASVARSLIEAYRSFIEKAHAAGILIYGVPILPFGGSSYDRKAQQDARRAVNEWIRSSGEFDAVVDLDAAVRDPEDPDRLEAAYDCGDGLHLSPAGYQRMADAIDLGLFR